MDNTTKLSEDLLDAWLNISSKLWNERMTKYLSFNQAIICRLLYAKRTASPQEPYLSMKQLCDETGILKSQMNKILTELENDKLIIRERSETDKRIINIKLIDDNIELYRKEHINIARFINKIIENIGIERSKEAIEILNVIAAEINKLNMEGNN